MNRSAVLSLAALAVLGACSEVPVAPRTPVAPALAASRGAVARVTTRADAGPGSLRAAVLAANADASVGAIRFERGLGPIALEQSVTYTGAQRLEIDGGGAEVDGGALGELEGAIAATGGGDFTIRDLTVRNAPGVGIAVLLPSDAAGTIAVTLDGVQALDNGLHGVLVNDQAGYLTDPESPSPDGSDAALRVRITGSRFEGNGFAAIDQDGVRVNEGGRGDLDAVIRQTRVVGNGGDGVELDERGTGNAVFEVNHTELLRNGAFTAEDYDDGIDVDESGDGDVDGRFVHVTASENFEQGVDLNENDAGDLRVTMNQVEASGNAEEGVEFEEDDDVAGGGDLVARLQNVTTRGNGANDGDAGLKVREKGEGDVDARIVNPIASDNRIGGVLVREDAAGDLGAVVVRATANANGGDGIAFDENGAGNLDARVQRAVASGNAGAGVAAEQAAPGAGTLRLQALTAAGKGEGAVTADASVTLELVPAP